jgi:hypothetical protein
VRAEATFRWVLVIGLTNFVHYSLQTGKGDPAEAHPQRTQMEWIMNPRVVMSSNEETGAASPATRGML